EALAAMGDLSTLAAMRARLDQGDPPLDPALRVRTALILHQRAPDPQLADHLVAVLGAPWSRRQVDSPRVDAAIGLRRFDGDGDEAALLVAVGDPCYLVRYHACESLLMRWGARRLQITDYPDIFALIRGGDHLEITDTLAAHHDEARRRLRELRP